MTPLHQSPWGYRSLGPWMTSIEGWDGAVSVVLVYSLHDVAERLFPHLHSTDPAVRMVAVDARGQMIFGMDKRAEECVAVKELMDAGLAILETVGDFEAIMGLMSISDTIRESAQRRGLA